MTTETFSEKKKVTSLWPKKKKKKEICVFPATSPKKIGKGGRFYIFIFFSKILCIMFPYLTRNTKDVLFARNI